MTEFRLYFLDNAGRIKRREDISCDTLADAVQVAIDFDHQFAIEIWSMDKMLVIVPSRLRRKAGER